MDYLEEAKNNLDEAMRWRSNTIKRRQLMERALAHVITYLDTLASQGTETARIEDKDESRTTMDSPSDVEEPTLAKILQFSLWDTPTRTSDAGNASSCVHDPSPNTRYDMTLQKNLTNCQKCGVLLSQEWIPAQGALQGFSTLARPESQSYVSVGVQASMLIRETQKQFHLIQELVEQSQALTDSMKQLVRLLMSPSGGMSKE